MTRQKMHIIIFPLLCILLCGCLSGCNKKSEEEKNLLLKMCNAISANDITYVSQILDFSMAGTTLTMNFDLWIDHEKAIQYSESNSYIKIGNQSVQDDMLMYAEQDENKIHTYLYSRLTDKWTYAEESFSTAEQATTTYFDYALLPTSSQIDELTLDWNTALIDARQTYVVHYTLSSTKLQSLLTISGLSTSSSDELDFSILNQYDFPVKYYIDTETYLPLRIEISIVPKPKEETLLDKLSKDDDDEIMTFPFTLILKDISYSPQDVPVVPEDIKDTYAPIETKEEMTESGTEAEIESETEPLNEADRETDIESESATENESEQEAENGSEPEAVSDQNSNGIRPIRNFKRKK